jgi:hypothetical protein
MGSCRLIVWVSGLFVALSGAFLTASGAQVELDRIVSRVQGRIVTQSDVRQARVLKLVDETSSDAATLRGLETRLLVLHELSRAAPLPSPGAPEVDARRAEWVATIGGEGQVPGLLQQAGMSPADLDSWLRDDLRIRAYLRRQFGMLGDAERAQGMAEWLARLRQRADLPQ